MAATNRDLVKACESEVFRPDLYDRLNVVPLHIPPLRARRDDIPLLAKHFLELAAKANGRPGIRLEDDAIQILASYSFPGNVRELPGGSAPKAHGLYRPGIPLRVLVEEAERQIIRDALTHHAGQMAATARALDLERSHLYTKARALGLRGAEKGEDDEA